MKENEISRTRIRRLSGILFVFLLLWTAFFGLVLIARDSAFAGHNTPQLAETQTLISLVPVATVSFSPVDISNSGLPGDERLFVVQQNGVIQIIDPEAELSTRPFLNIQDRVSGGSEMGLLGLVFDPGYATNGYFYVNYTHRDNSDDIFTRVSRFLVTADPNIGDPNSETIIFSVQQPYPNHNGGDLNFGPDGYLYIGLGDGGSGGDPGNRAQKPLTPLGKMLRIDVSGTTSTTNYTIPPDNPFVGPGSLEEIWSLGLRNPWRFSFDRDTGAMFIADVGQDAWEEIDFQPASSAGGENWGWRCYEGLAPYYTTGCGSSEEYDFPVHAYGHNTPGCSVTGGYVYRGERIPFLRGAYLFADYCFGHIWSLEFDGDWQLRELGTFDSELFTTFGEDIHGELLIASSSNNTIYRISFPVKSYLPLIKRHD
jgi:glucose/arabinose dehydrogenase